eukprot:3538476-Lingulodinium_polyedra.AAC.1
MPSNGIPDWNTKIGAFSLISDSSFMVTGIKHTRSGVTKPLPLAFKCSLAQVGNTVLINKNWFESEACLLNEEDGSSQVLAKKLFKVECEALP